MLIKFQTIKTTKKSNLRWLFNKTNKTTSMKKEPNRPRYKILSLIHHFINSRWSREKYSGIKMLVLIWKQPDLFCLLGAFCWNLSLVSVFFSFLNIERNVHGKISIKIWRNITIRMKILLLRLLMVGLGKIVRHTRKNESLINFY